MPWLPCLTELGFKVLKPRTAVALATYCPQIQSYRSFFNIHPSESKEEIILYNVNTVEELLHRCPHLKTLSATGHRIEAVYILAKPWDCRGLKTLRCQIVGMDRLTSEEEDSYKSWITATDQDSKENDELAETEDVVKAMEAMEKHRCCHELQERVYDRLAEMDG